MKNRPEEMKPLVRRSGEGAVYARTDIGKPAEYDCGTSKI